MIYSGSYDIVTAVSVFAESGHMSPDSIRDMARMVKPGMIDNRYITCLVSLYNIVFI